MNFTPLFDKIATLMTGRHWVEMFVAWFFFSNFVSALPTPKPGTTGFLGSAWYEFLYQFAHLMAANIAKFVRIILPWFKNLLANGNGTPPGPPKADGAAAGDQ